MAGQVVEEVLHWSRNAMEVRRLCARKEEMFRELRGSITPAIPPGTMTLLEVLERNNVRASSRAHHPAGFLIAFPQISDRSLNDWRLLFRPFLDFVIQSVPLIHGRTQSICA